LAPNVCLHWSFSEWRGENRPTQQNFDPSNPNLTLHQLDYYTRIAMLGGFGLSQKLPELPAWVASRLAYHIKIYREEVRQFVSAADLSRLTGQPRRDGMGERWVAFQYSLPDTDQHLLFVFRLPGVEKKRVICLLGLKPDCNYSVSELGGETKIHKSGRELMESGLIFENVAEEGSLLLSIRPGI
jgi:alpha-galactosidase